MVTPANDYYGHRKILTSYMGVPDDTPFGGILQHGWQLGPWLSSVRPWPQFVWGARDVSSIQTSILRRAVCGVVGAPFLYHPRVQTGMPSERTDHLLAMPYHGHGVDLDGAHRHYSGFLESLRSDYNGITVCLHPLDFASEVRNLYSSRGFVTVTNGSRLAPSFLDNLLDLLQTHGAMTTNRAATGLFYAALLGRRVFVNGPFPRSASRVMKGMTYEDQFKLYGREFPGLADGIEGAEATRLGAYELGAEFVQPPNALAALLLVERPVRWIVRGIATTNTVRRRLKRSKIGPKPEALGKRGERVHTLRTFGSGVSSEGPTLF